MRKLTLPEWAAVAEILATLAVVVSLYFVVQSLNLNTRAIQASNDNFIYGLQDTNIAEVVLSADLSEIAKKAFEGSPHTEFEAFRWRLHLSRFLNLWELIYTRHEDGLMPDDAWEAWNRSAIGTFNNLVSDEQWQRFRASANLNFRDHVDQIIADREKKSD